MTTVSFWKHSPGPTWGDRFRSFFVSAPPRLAYPLRDTVSAPPADLRWTVRRATAADVPALAIFLRDEYSITKRSICVLPPAYAASQIQSESWIAMLAWKDGHLVGSIVSRSLGRCVYGNERLGVDAGYIDFFCIAKTEQKAGLGSLLLRWIEYETLQQHRSIHFFAKEFRSLSVLPPLWNGRFCVRRNTPHTELGVLVYSTPDPHARHDISVWPPQPQPQPTHRYVYNGVTAVVTDTFHIDRDTGKSIGHVLSVEYSSDAPIFSEGGYPVLAHNVETILDASPFGFILMDTTHPHTSQRGWTTDAPYSIYCYNTLPPKWRTLPAFWF